MNRDTYGEIKNIETYWLGCTANHKSERKECCIQWLQKKDIPFYSANYNIHIKLTIGETIVDLWPTTAKIRFSGEVPSYLNKDFTYFGTSAIITYITKLLKENK
jgi:hypothetical protein